MSPPKRSSSSCVRRLDRPSAKPASSTSRTTSASSLNCASASSCFTPARLWSKPSVLDLFEQPLHPYTLGLIRSVPKPGESKRPAQLRVHIAGNPPSLDAPAQRLRLRRSLPLGRSTSVPQATSRRWRGLPDSRLGPLPPLGGDVQADAFKPKAQPSPPSPLSQYTGLGGASHRRLLDSAAIVAGSH